MHPKKEIQPSRGSESHGNQRQGSSGDAADRRVRGEQNMETTLTTHKIATREEWQAARTVLLEREKEHTRTGDELAQQLRSLPWVRVEKEYTLQTADGPKTLAELFDGRSQLMIYHFMFGPSYAAGTR
jgi:predicted dithiol-disulfide oxidoreductase (DUF899 family)